MKRMVKDGRVVADSLIETELTEITPFKKKVLELFNKSNENIDALFPNRTVSEERWGELTGLMLELKETALDVMKDANNRMSTLKKEVDKLDPEILSSGYGITEFEKKVDGEVSESMSKVNTIHNLEAFLKAKAAEVEWLTEFIGNLSEKSPIVVDHIIASTLCTDLVNVLASDPEAVSMWKNDWNMVKEIAEKENEPEWAIIIKYLTLPEIKLKLLRFQNEFANMQDKLINAYNKFIHKEDKISINSGSELPLINWAGESIEARYKDHDAVVRVIHDELYKEYLENSHKVQNAELKELGSICFTTKEFLLSPSSRDSRLLEALTMPDPIRMYSYSIDMFMRPVIEGIYSEIGLEEYYEFTLYILTLLRDPRIMWLTFVFSGHGGKVMGEQNG